VRRAAGTVERAAELVAAALTWQIDVQVTVITSKTGGRLSYVVETVDGPENEPQTPILGGEAA
jgi:hypothetical protein